MRPIGLPNPNQRQNPFMGINTGLPGANTGTPQFGGQPKPQANPQQKVTPPTFAGVSAPKAGPNPFAAIPTKATTPTSMQTAAGLGNGAVKGDLSNPQFAAGSVAPGFGGVNQVASRLNVVV